LSEAGLERKLAEMQGVAVRHTLTVKVSGREVSATTTNFTNFSAAPIADSLFQRRTR